MVHHEPAQAVGDVAKGIFLQFLRGLYVCAAAWFIAFAVWWLCDYSLNTYMAWLSLSGEIAGFLFTRLFMVLIVAGFALSGYWLIFSTSLVLAITLSIDFVLRRPFLGAVVGFLAAIGTLPFLGFFGLHLELPRSGFPVSEIDLVILSMRSFLQYGYPTAMAVAGYYLSITAGKVKVGRATGGTRQAAA